MKVNKIGFLASADAAKPAIIIERLSRYKLLRGYEMVLFTVGNCGKCYTVCQKFGIKIVQLENEKLNEQGDLELIKFEHCDLLISMGWPNLVPKAVLDIFAKSINCHGSILPDYRGSRSYMHYYSNLEPNYGASIHYMNEKFDDGKVLIQAGYQTLPNENNDDMHIRTAELCAFLLPTAIHLVENDDEGYEPSGEKRYFYKRTPEEFEEYRKRNEQLKKEGKPLVLTPHKVL